MIGEVLVVLEGVHQVLPGEQPESVPYKLLAPPEAGAPSTQPDGSTPAVSTTEADRLKDRIRRQGEMQGVKFGQPGKIPDFNQQVEQPKRPPAPAPVEPPQQ